MVITFVVQGVTIGAYAARLAGVQTQRIATSISLFNLFMTAGRLANLFSAVMIGPLADKAGNTVRALWGQHQYAAIASIQRTFEWQLRLVVFAGTLGMIAFSLFLPTFIYLFKRGIRSFEKRGSLPHSLFRLADSTVIGDVVRSVRIPRIDDVRTFSFRDLPARMLIFNIVVTCVYAIGVVASNYASVLDVNSARTALQLSGIINGIGTIAFTLFVDPTSSIITDQAAKGERPLGEVKAMVFYLSLTAILGTVISQLILWPSSYLIAAVAHFFTHAR